MIASAEQTVTVGLGEVKTATGALATVLLALGLGSCVGVVLFDPLARVGGMAHVVLPEPPEGTATSSKFATHAVPLLLERVLALGAERERLVCKIAGGAQVLAVGTMRDSFRIGERNVAAVQAALRRLGIVPRAADCGGTTGRSLRLSLSDGRVAVKRLGEDWREL
jgi:chemotaxis protein CheD